MSKKLLGARSGVVPLWGAAQPAPSVTEYETVPAAVPVLVIRRCRLKALPGVAIVSVGQGKPSENIGPATSAHQVPHLLPLLPVVPSSVLVRVFAYSCSVHRLWSSQGSTWVVVKSPQRL